MDPITGVLRTRIPIDRELGDNYILSVAISNGISIGYCQVGIFQIHNSLEIDYAGRLFYGLCYNNVIPRVQQSFL